MVEFSNFSGVFFCRWSAYGGGSFGPDHPPTLWPWTTHPPWPDPPLTIFFTFTNPIQTYVGFVCDFWWFWDHANGNSDVAFGTHNAELILQTTDRCAIIPETISQLKCNRTLDFNVFGSTRWMKNYNSIRDADNNPLANSFSECMAQIKLNHWQIFFNNEITIQSESPLCQQIDVIM